MDICGSSAAVPKAFFLKEELKTAYKEQLKEEKAARQKAEKENKEKLLKLIEESGKTPEEIMELLRNNS